MEDEGPVKEPTAPQVNDVAPPAQATAPTGPAPVRADEEDAPVPQAEVSAPQVGNEVQAAPARPDDEEETNGDANAQEEQVPLAEHPVPTPPKPAADKPHGTTLAIVAAVVIVIALGAMLTYAYLRS